MQSKLTNFYFNLSAFLMIVGFLPARLRRQEGNKSRFLSLSMDATYILTIDPDKTEEQDNFAYRSRAGT